MMRMHCAGPPITRFDQSPSATPAARSLARRARKLGRTIKMPAMISEASVIGHSQINEMPS